MIPAPFDYVRAESLDHAVQALAEHGDEAKLLAGGHSLLPLMKLRLATPSVLIDIGRVDGASYVRDEGDAVAIGALTRHRDLATDDLLEDALPILRHAAAGIGDPQVRHRGTIGGSVAHGDPASDLGAVLLALEATFRVRGPSGERTIAAGSFFEGFLETALAPDEVLEEIRVPKATGAGWSFQKMTLRAQDWAIVGVACVAGAPGRSDGARIALVNMGATPLRASGVEEALAAGEGLEAASSRAAEATEPPSDLNASAEFREHLARVLVSRALREAL